MLRCAFFDLDGTLLNNQKQIPASARQAILRCRALGVRTYIVTARSPRLNKTLGWTDAGLICLMAPSIPTGQPSGTETR